MALNCYRCRERLRKNSIFTAHPCIKKRLTLGDDCCSFSGMYLLLYTTDRCFF